MRADDDDTGAHDPNEPTDPGGQGGVPRRSSLLLHAALFLATFLTTSMAGALKMHASIDGGGWFDMLRQVMPIGDGLSYSVPLMGILLCHELGHYFAARAHGVDASLPFFIPLPPWFGLGTLGAVIGMRRVTTDRRKLIDIGAAGPLAGLAVAIPVLIYGLSLSDVGPLAPVGMEEGNSLLYAVLKHVVKGHWLPDGHQDVYLHPTAWAGWVGLLVTMINLLPIGQLDGGHIATAYFGNGYNTFARRLHKLMPLVAVGVFGWVYHLVRVEMGERWHRAFSLSAGAGAGAPWLLWYALVSILRRAGGGANHPPVDAKALPASRKLLFWFVVVAFVGIFMPVPFRETRSGAPPPPDATSAALP
ncbi:MAG: integral rane protease [Myxococcales bacterium]|nr:integral rane protease [Myxococcales bacterium]